MSTQSARSASALDGALQSLVETTVAQKELHGICQMLGSIAESMDAYGCFLWQASDDSDLRADPPRGSLSVIAHWFSDGSSWAFEGIELDSVVGQVAATGTARNVLRIEDAPYISQKFYWWMETDGIRSFCAVPVSFVDGPAGALAIYRREDPPFSEQEVAVAMRLAAVLPGLYQAVRDRVSFDLVARIEELTGQTPLSDDMEIRATLQMVCRAIGQTFNSHETSIFLRDSLTGLDEFRLQATTWPSETPFSPQCYRPDDIGITPWVLRSAQAIRLFNLGGHEPGKPIDNRSYPGLVWKDPLSLVPTMMIARGASKREELPPLSYMCTPVMEGNRVLGAIRCCSMLKPPFIFASRDLALLKVAAALVGKYQSTGMEVRAWRGFVKSFSRLNQFSEEELARDAPRPERISDAYQELKSKYAGRKDEFLNVMQELVQQQEQLYGRLGVTIAERTRAQSALQNTLEEQRQTYEDLFHQIKSPINIAFETIRTALDGAPTRNAYRLSLETLRSQLRRANRITRAVGIFAELAAKQQVQAHRTVKLQAWSLQRAVTELAEDYERMQEKYREIRFEVEPRGFEVLNTWDVWVDQDLLFHALASVFDNAGKYSYACNRVRVSAGLTGTKRFHISVASTGLRIRPQDLSHLTERGFRSEEAVSASGEGSGIGLFLVERIMEAHSGELLIIPCNQEGETEVKLLFPLENARLHQSHAHRDS